MKRELVVEFRFTFELLGYKIRYWTETSEAFGGVVDPRIVRQHIVDAQIQLTQDVIANRRAQVGLPQQPDPLSVATNLLAAIREANSIEVCDEHGEGIAVHRDWP